MKQNESKTAIAYCSRLLPNSQYKTNKNLKRYKRFSLGKIARLLNEKEVPTNSHFPSPPY